MDDYGVLRVVTRKKATLVRKHTCGGLDFGTFVYQGFCGFHNERRQKRGLCEKSCAGARKEISYGSRLEELVKLHDEHDEIRHTKIRMEKGTTELNTISHNVSPVEIDFNGHTNNQNYVRLVVSLVPSHFIESHNLVDFHIKYAQETFLGDKLIATLQEYGETCLSCDIRKATDQSLVCEISSHWEHR